MEIQGVNSSSQSTFGNVVAHLKLGRSNQEEMILLKMPTEGKLNVSCFETLHLQHEATSSLETDVRKLSTFLEQLRKRWNFCQSLCKKTTVEKNFKSLRLPAQF